MPAFAENERFDWQMRVIVSNTEAIRRQKNEIYAMDLPHMFSKTRKFLHSCQKCESGVSVLRFNQSFV
jgi:hypothetical protein